MRAVFIALFFSLLCGRAGAHFTEPRLRGEDARTFTQATTPVDGRTFKDERHGLTEETHTEELWAGWLPVMEERKKNGTYLGRRWFQWGADLSGTLEGAGGIGGLVGIIEEDGAGVVTRTLLPVQDGLGNITAVIDQATGRTVARYDYGPFGEPLAESGEVDACPFRWQTKWYDAESQHYYFGYRHYDPRFGRWLSRDPLGEAGGFNLYAYCGNDPVNGWDYLGMEGRKKEDRLDKILRKAAEASSHIDSATGKFEETSNQVVRGIIHINKETDKAVVVAAKMNAMLIDGIEGPESPDNYSACAAEFGQGALDVLRVPRALILSLGPSVPDERTLYRKIVDGEYSAYKFDITRNPRALGAFATAELISAGLPLAIPRGRLRLPVQSRVALLNDRWQEALQLSRDIRTITYAEWGEPRFAYGVKGGLTGAQKVLYGRVSYPSGFRQMVWERAKAPDGNVYDPTGRILKFDEPWELGHLPVHKFSEAQLRAVREGWDRPTWLRYQTDPDIYRPELPSTNARSLSD